MPSREQYVAQRIGARMQQRGEPMTLRRVSLTGGPVPYANPPDVSSDTAVTTGVTVAGQAYLGLGGSTVVGRLLPGDQVICTGATGTTTWTVVAMPTNILTDSDGIPMVAADGTPQTGTPTIYNAAALAANDAFPCIPVTAPGAPDPAANIGNSVSFAFVADQPVYGYTLSFEEMTALGWTEVDAIGLRLAAWSGGPLQRPDVNDVVIVSGKPRSIVSLGPIFRNGVDLAYVIQAR